jgi:hypothetical protein
MPQRRISTAPPGAFSLEGGSRQESGECTKYWPEGRELCFRVYLTDLLGDGFHTTRAATPVVRHGPCVDRPGAPESKD